MRLKFNVLLLVILSTIFITNCQRETITTKEVPPTGEPYPPPNSVNSELLNAEPYPINPSLENAGETPSFSESQLVIPTPLHDTGVVVGKLKVSNGSNGRPYLATLYLARTVQPKQEGFPPLVAFSEDSDPKAIQDVTGQFIFADIPPGTYAIIIWTPIASSVIQDPNTKEHLLFQVKAGEITDLGAIIIP